MAVANAALPASVLVVNELYVDHPGADDGHEFVELFAARPVAVAAVSLEFHNGSGGDWVPVWSGATGDTIRPNSLYVVGGRFVKPTADAVVDLALQNGPDAIRVLVAGVETDRVGYGGLDDSLWGEGRGAPDVDAGRSIARQPDGRDTNNNAADFFDARPSPGRWNVPRYDAGIVLVSSRVAASLPPCHVVWSVVNAGIFPLDSVRVVIADSSRNTEGVLARRITGPLRPGDSEHLAVDVPLGDGYHALVASVTHRPDESAANDTARAYRRVGDPGVRVSEVWPSPPVGCPQFMELYHGGRIALPLSGWGLRDAAHALHTLPRSARALRPGKFVVITPDSSALVRCIGGVDPRRVAQFPATWPTFNRTGRPVADSVIVVDAWGLSLDRVGYPPPDGSASLERVNLFGGGQAVWVASHDERGASPGEAGDVALLSPAPAGRLVVVPNPFHPTMGEVLRVSITAASSTDTGARAGVYDTAGRRVRNLGAVSVLPAVFVWDGNTDAGSPAAAGLYVVSCRFETQDGKTTTRLRTVVGCARGR